MDSIRFFKVENLGFVATVMIIEISGCELQTVLNPVVFGEFLTKSGFELVKEGRKRGGWQKLRLVSIERKLIT